MARFIRARRHGVVAAAALLLLVGLTPAAAADSEDPGGSRDPGAVLAWNAIAWRTIAVEGLKPPPVAQLYLGLVSTAVHNAVVTVEGKGAPTLRQSPVGSEASSDVAAATAAHDVLSFFFPASTAALDTDYDGWLAGVPEGTGAGRGPARRAGRCGCPHRVPRRRRARRARPLARPAEPPPGTWVPTGTGEWLTPWLAFTRPILIDSATQFAPDGPEPLGSADYAEDLAEVELMGAATGSGRSEADTALALFWFDNPPRQYQDAMRDRAVRHEMDIVESARMFAAANASGADAGITCWRAKYESNYWRPLTAIQQADRDGNDATTADPAWSSLRPAPPTPSTPAATLASARPSPRPWRSCSGRATWT